MAFIVRKSSTSVKSVSTPTPVSRLQDALDTNFGTLDSDQDGKYVTYDDTTSKFILSTADELLLESVSDNDIPDDFIRTLENEINLSNILSDVDGGTF